jgi:hypothetical protein
MTRRLTPRRRAASRGGTNDAITREAEQLARQARSRLGVSGASPASLAKIDVLDSPIDRLRALLDLGDELAPTLPASVVEHGLPAGKWGRKRLGDLEAGRTFQIRKLVTREDGVVLNLPMYPGGDPA